MYFGLIIGNIVDGSRLIERVIVMGDNMRHFRDFAIWNSVSILEKKQSGD